MSTIYECESCNVLGTQPQELCQPTEVMMRCDYGRDLEGQKDAMCKTTRHRVDSHCDMCGRITLQDELVCMPTQLDS
mgnify:CR=1 FL=1